MAISAAELAAFERDGAVTVSSPLSAEQLDAAERAWDRLREQETSHRPDKRRGHTHTDSTEIYGNEDFMATIAMPYFEQLAAAVLRSDEVHILETFPHARNPTEHPASGEWPHWKEVWKDGSHIDVQLTSDDFDATPRREQLVMWLWLSDVTEDSGAMVSDHHPFLSASSLLSLELASDAPAGRAAEDFARLAPPADGPLAERAPAGAPPIPPPHPRQPPPPDPRQPRVPGGVGRGLARAVVGAAADSGGG